MNEPKRHDFVFPPNEEDRRLVDPLEGRYKRRDDIPDCCANCKNNLWNEDGPHCAVDLTTGNDLYDVLDCGNVDWNGWCPRHERGEPRHDL